MSQLIQTPPEERTLLSVEINMATKKQHTNLNRLITSRLPLALPPHCTTPRLYGTGLLRFAPIYLTFESTWLNLLQPPLESQDHTGYPLKDLDSIHHALLSPAPDGDTRRRRPSISFRARECLERLLIPGLMRGERLKEDLGYITGLGVVELRAHLDNPVGKQVVEFREHIRSTVPNKPHLLVAYTWVMYMAIFSGGRWIREQILLAGDRFWSHPAACAGISMSGREARATTGMEFFNFKGSEDGEDIKSEYKRRFAELDQLLTPSERQDVVSEAVRIFEFNTQIVNELDEQLAGQGIVPSRNSTHLIAGPRPKQPTEGLLRTDSWVKEFKSQAAKIVGGRLPSSPSLSSSSSSSSSISTPEVVVAQQRGSVNQESESPNRTTMVIRAILVAILGIFLWLLLH
ncbi:MAG: heme oxygenase [Geoglossum umbratile]|nr:MAG: heme oxygenase [Geoglossum umbratile]